MGTNMVNREFLSTIADMVMDVYEVSCSRILGREMRPTESQEVGIFKFTYNDLWHEIEVFGETFRWSAAGKFISGPAKTWGQWTEWLNFMMVMFNRSLGQKAAA